jgi:hypothetical protein
VTTPRVSGKTLRITLAVVSVSLAVASAWTLSVVRSARVSGVSDTGDTPTFFFPATGFGGYAVNEKVHTVSAEWRVPAILPKSRPGVAATWIGAQTSVNDAFIQIGVNEFVGTDAAPQYLLFWSDTAKNFHPQSLGVASAGELIFFSMTHNASGWLLQLHNQSKSLSVKQEIHYGKGVSFSVAEWIQENPAPGAITPVDAPYPNIANATFQQLKVNGVSPRLRRSDGQVLIASSGAIRVPTLVTHDSFTFHAPRGAARQYLEDARRLDAGVSSFDAKQVRWSTIALTQRRRDVTALIRVLRVNVKVFKTQTWPKKSQKPLSELDALTSTQISLFEAWSHTSMSLDGVDFLKFTASIPLHDRYVDQIRTSLNLPPLN